MNASHIWRRCLLIPLLSLLWGAMPQYAEATILKKTKKIVLIAGPITGHDKHTHEYEKNVTLLKQLLDTSPNLKGAKVEAHFKGWPQDESTLDDADTIVMISDGGDHNETDHPLYVGSRFQTLAKQMKRGCGLVQFHWTTFNPSRYHDQITEWVGGYFDYETGKNPNHWLSAIQTWEGMTSLGDANHPVLRGVQPFKIKEEFYYNIRFRENDPRLTPLLLTRPPNETRDHAVGWAVQRADGGRGFGFTGGHFYENWRLPDYRKLILNAIVWTAGMEVPNEGVASVMEAPIRALIVTGYHHPGHDWRLLTAALILALEQDPRMRVEVTESVEDLASDKISDYDLLVLNYNNWDRAGLSARAQENFLKYLKKGGGLALIHFANGAFNYTLPNKESEWTEFRTKVVARAWMHDADSSHDAFGAFSVSAAHSKHAITKGLAPFDTEDELYFNQKGDLKVEPLAVATSKVTKQVEPMAWAYNYGKGRIFQTVLGHADVSVRRAAALIRRGGVWAAKRRQLTFDPPTSLTENALFRNGSSWTLQSSINRIKSQSIQASRTLLASGSHESGNGIAAKMPTLRKKDTVDWGVVGNDAGGMRYSKLTQIRRENVKRLKVAWTYRTGDAGDGTTIECTPIVVEGVMYVTTVKICVVALDAATGNEIWKFDPKSGGVNRGVAYWSDKKPNGERRIVLGTPDGRLFSLDAKTGIPDPKFGKSGVLDLRAGIERDLSRLNYGVTSAPAIFENTVILGFVNSEGQPGAPGDVRAFNVMTGKEVWRFHTVPQPYEFGNETWEGDGWKERSGVNPWSGFTIDTKRGIVFCGTGSAAGDFYGGDRKGTNLFANCTLALNARTGKRLWHFQTVHHDLWDHDTPCPPVLVTVKRDGKTIDAVAQPTKTGYCYVFDRVTGKPLFDVEEVAAPPSDIPGEQAHPTQPRPVRPPLLNLDKFGDEDVTNISPEATAYVREQLKKHNYGKAHLPPSVRGTIVTPGFHGGATWSGASFDPTTGLLYVNTNNVPYLAALNPDGKGNFNFGGYTYFNDAQGYPAIKPPWGYLTAVDLTKGEFAWRKVLGTHPELIARGIPQTGTENFGGTIVTAGGLVFIGGTKDEMFHAFDKATGELLWETRLPAGGYASPSTYMVNGKQFVAIGAGGGGKLRTKSGDYYIAFTLGD